MFDHLNQLIAVFETFWVQFMSLLYRSHFLYNWVDMSSEVRFHFKTSGEFGPQRDRVQNDTILSKWFLAGARPECLLSHADELFDERWYWSDFYSVHPGLQKPKMRFLVNFDRITEFFNNHFRVLLDHQPEKVFTTLFMLRTLIPEKSRNSSSNHLLVEINKSALQPSDSQFTMVFVLPFSHLLHRSAQQSHGQRFMQFCTLLDLLQFIGR